MPVWTKEQLSAINEEGKNIIVSAGAGSGKTAVLTNRVIRKIKEGTKILILTFTNLAAKEMKERIKKNLKKEGLMDEYNLIDSSYITTFDSYSLTVLKKYHYLLDVSPNVNILDSSALTLVKKDIIDIIFDELYRDEDPKFIKLINDFCMKDDDNIKSLILDLSSKLDLVSDKSNFLNKYISNHYNEDNYNFLIDSFMNLLKNKINILKELLDDLSYYTEKEVFDKIYDFYSPLVNSNTYEDIRRNSSEKNISIKLEDEAKRIKENINDCYNDIKSICEYNSLDEAKEEIIYTKEYIECIIDILIKLDKYLDKYKYERDQYTFNDIEKLAIKIVKENEDVRNEIKDSVLKLDSHIKKRNSYLTKNIIRGKYK